MHPTEEALRRAIDAHKEPTYILGEDPPWGLIARVQVLAEFLDAQCDPRASGLGPRASGYAALLRAMTDNRLVFGLRWREGEFQYVWAVTPRCIHDMRSLWMQAAGELLGWRKEKLHAQPGSHSHRLFLPDNSYGDPSEVSFSDVLDALAQTAEEHYDE